MFVLQMHGGLYMKKYNYIDLAKTITMFLVILFHCLLFFADNPYWVFNADYENDVAIFICNIFNCTLVPLFVFCSGFLFQISTKKKEINIATAVFKRAKRLLLPYLLYGFLWLVPTYTIFDIPSYGRAKGSSLLDGYKSMLLGQFTDVAWFLLMLFWVSAIWIILRRLLEKERLIIGAVITTILYFTAHNLLSGVDYYKLNEIDIYIVIFFAGAVFYWFADTINKLPASILMLISVSGMLVCAMLAQYTSISYWIYDILKVVMPVIMVMFAMGLCKLKTQIRIESNHIYKWLLRHNMDIYLMQAPGMYLSFMIFYPLIGKYCFLCVTISFTITIVFDFIIVLLLTFIRSALMRFIGEKRQ